MAVCVWSENENILGAKGSPCPQYLWQREGTINAAVQVPLHGAKERHTQCKEPLPSGSVWSGRPFLVECVSIGRATESAEQRANLNFFFASLKEEKYFLNTFDERPASSMCLLSFLFNNA